MAKTLRWRVKSDDDGGFDELVVSAGEGQCLIHAEMMNRRSIFVSIGEVKLWAHVDKKGRVHVTGAEGATLDEGARAMSDFNQRVRVAVATMFAADDGLDFADLTAENWRDSYLAYADRAIRETAAAIEEPGR